MVVALDLIPSAIKSHLQYAQQRSTLNNGTKMPSIGLGCWLPAGVGEATNPSARAEKMCKKALPIGYRHFDTAAKYGSEQGLGAAIRDSGVPREELYIVTKLWNDDHHRVRDALEESLAHLGCGYIDLYLMHWPQATINGKTLPPGEHPTFVDTWKEMEKLLETGKAKSIGVSNFSVKTLTELLPHCKVIPATNQVQLHPYLPQFELHKFCEDHGILLTAYSPLGAPAVSPRDPSLLVDPTITTIAQKHGAEPAQVLLSWGVKRGIAVIPKSESEVRMRTNLKLVDLDEADVNALNNLHREPGKHRSVLTRYSAVPGEIFGWTFEWLGWNMAKDGTVL